MQIQWLGQSFFRLTAKNNGAEVDIAIDPFSESCGLKPAKFNADILAITRNHEDNNNADAIKGEPFTIIGPGEYETKGIFIYGIPAWREGDGAKGENTTLYRVSAEGMSIVHLGNLNHELSTEQLEKLGDVDILLIPVGGENALDSKKAAELVSEIEPRIVIPMYYQLPGLKTKLKTVEEFLKASGLPHEKMDKFKIAKKDLPIEDTKVIVLTA